MQVVDALGEDGLLRYRGISYGATLGATVAAMYSDRIDKLILDGVQNAQDYYHSLAAIQQWEDADESFSGIWSTCITAGSELCPLAASWNDSKALEAAVWNLTYSLKQNPIVVGGVNGSLVIDYTWMKNQFLSSSYTTTGWPLLAGMVDLLLKGQNDESLYQVAQLVNPSSFNATAELATAITAAAQLGIQCSDRTARTDDFALMDSIEDELAAVSHVAAGTTDVTDMTCSQWKMQAKGGYEGASANITTKNPLLIINNKYDGHTPLVLAYNASAAFVGSSVLVIDCYGHASVNLPSKCAIAASAAYWVNRTLPANGTVCPADIAPYEPLPTST